MFQTRTRRLVSIIGIIVTIVLVFQTFTLPSRIALSPLFPSSKNPALKEYNVSSNETSSNSMRVGKLSLLNETAELSDDEGEMDGDPEDNGDDLDDDIDFGDDEDPDTEFSIDMGDGVVLKKVGDPVHEFITLERVADPKYNSSSEKLQEPANGFAFVSDGIIDNRNQVDEKSQTIDNESSLPSITSSPIASFVEANVQGVLDANSSDRGMENTTLLTYSSDQVEKELVAKKGTLISQQSGLILSSANSTNTTVPFVRKKKRVMPPVYFAEMNRLLIRNRAAYHSMRPRWSLARDKEILAAKAQIENAPILENDRQLYSPVFRNISMFKMSYELMARTLKVYVYKEGQKPIFHQPLLKGIYASEGWFMKLMETNRHYLVKDPRKAHLFYMPFSSRFLQFALYVRNSHNRRNLEQHLRNYVDMISAKYPFWNRTGGADHFLAACHDWAPFETRHTMERAIRALCVADLREGFRLGKDVSLPETYVRSAQNPQRDLGGRPANRRPTLAFFAGNMHGRLRPILLRHWENKDPDMKIFGPMPPGVSSKMSYIQQMKTSKYCICPRGYEANSPRVVESIFYECVPVLISDNYVPPFFEVLNWEAFSVIIPEEDVPRLKEILLSIPQEKYLALQEGVRKVQQHFLWHSKPVKYDLFHMTLHSIWFNRVHQIRTR